METYGRILLIAMPVFLLLVLFEKWYGWRKGKETVRTMDMISSLSSGITNVTKDVLGLSIAIISYGWLADHLAIVKVPDGWPTYVIAFIALDFAGYWTHRIAHEYNFFWNNHIIHHSSEDFNLACALRQSISSIVKLFTIFLLPAAFFGVPEQVVAVVAPLHLFAQFWYHTQHINKMGWLEKIIVTPSHHRVHHALNPEYLDKNYGQIFIFWDKLFGTYQEELDSVPAVYGITRPVRTWNPIKINFMHLWLLIQDAWRAQSWKDKFRIWLMPTGWRPKDVEEKYPVFKIEDPYHFEKYEPVVPATLRSWSWFQILICLLLISYLFGYIAQIGSPGIFLYGLFIFLMVYAYTELMDNHRDALYWEVAKNLLGLSILYYQRDWFGLSSLGTFLPVLLASYFIGSTLVVYYFVKQQSRPSLTP
ncbi:sterol desaturase family protein [Flavihumibacter cheonanensis]|jgi:alkylglycerol monooxygenase|uniref:sterol desaturase family protein n=1 Tax=Flavihumibacter cheonanensis TaxID=1442385 RepID=UPI001EF8BCC2|nr:sterol desaturase family protein [Flavihumibacter cheonanensis]MCG7751199.1 sterol desaturase family protein [Flavihumibacter cheonanensis]